MKKPFIMIIVLAALIAGFAAGTATNTEARYYQFTGEIKAIDDDAVTVQKGEETWTFKIDKATDFKGHLKVGAKVTVRYIMRATAIEVK